MIIGRGLVATAFQPYEASLGDRILFASGVSNSRETRESEFAREEGMLREALSLGRPLVYFGSCSIYDPELQRTPYVLHKLRMEDLIRGATGDFAIFRLPQVVGRSDNPNLLTNFLHDRIASGMPFQLWTRARRNLIDVDDIAAIAMAMLEGPLGISENIACPSSVAVSELVAIFERVLGKKARYTPVDAGGAYEINTAVSHRRARELGIDFDAGYAEAMIGKYYGR